MDSMVWGKNKHRLGEMLPSCKKLRMANGAIVPSEGAWEGAITVEGVRREGRFEIFDSGGGWSFLFGKPLQAAFGAVHDYAQDVVDITVGDAKASLSNQRGVRREKSKPAKVAGAPEAFKGVLTFAKTKTPARRVPSKELSTLNTSNKNQVAENVCVKTEGERGEMNEEGLPSVEESEVDVLPKGLHTRTNSLGARATPVREVPNVFAKEQVWGADGVVSEQGVQSTRWADEQSEEGLKGMDGTPSTRTNSTGDSATPVREVLAEAHVLVGNVTTDHDPSDSFDTEIYDTDAYVPIVAESIYTRASDPFNPVRVAEIQRLVQLGPDLDDTQRAEVQAFVGRYADIFALAVSEVCPVKDAVYAPKIPADYKFSTKVHQRPLTQPQAEYLHKQVEIMEAAGVIRPIHPRDVKCVSPIKLAQKEHDGGGLMQDELKHVLNDECVRAGLEPIYDLPP
ncbi:hypothetical protein B0H13DRAFT_858070 [Mycena leptocephala]|nr:hypothetical protein B0H13DRAFT_858070 [Mycena leptocephala]